MRHLFRSTLWNQSERRLRAPWRLLVGFGMVFGITVVVFVLLFGLLSVLGLAVAFEPQTQPFVMTAFGGLITVVAIGLLSQYIDRRLFTDYGFRLDTNWWLDCVFGLCLGAVLMTGIFLSGLAFGWFAVVDTARLADDFWPSFGVVLATFIVVGIYEELLLRGYLLTNLAEGFTWFDSLGHRGAVVAATLLSSSVFGVFHATNPNATLLSTLFISVAGVMLAAGYLFTGELAIPIGLHITWNVFQGVVYGFPVSGLTIPVSLIDTAPRGPAVVSGGAFGPEAGIVGLAAMVVGTAWIAGYVGFREGTLRLHPAITTPELRETPDSSVDDE